MGKETSWELEDLMVGIILGKLYGVFYRKKKQFVELEGIKARGQPTFSEHRSTLDHILTLRTLFEQ